MVNVEAGEGWRVVYVEIEGAVPGRKEQRAPWGHPDAGIAAHKAAVAADVHARHLAVDLKPGARLDVQRQTGDWKSYREILALGQVEQGGRQQAMEQEPIGADHGAEAKEPFVDPDKLVRPRQV
jgi:hypothetical protein